MIHLSARCSHSDNIVRRTQVYANEHSILIPTCEKSYIDICAAMVILNIIYNYVTPVTPVTSVTSVTSVMSVMSVTPARSVMLCTIFDRGIVDIPHRWRKVAIHLRASVVAQQRPRPLRRRSAAAGLPPPSSRWPVPS